MKLFILLVFFICMVGFSFAQPDDEIIMKAIFDEALADRTAYENLRYLCKQTPYRVTGSPAVAAAVEFTRQVMSQMGLDSVYLQPVGVPHWVRGQKEKAFIWSEKFGYAEVNVAALGLSVGTGETGLSAQVVEVKSFEELAVLGAERVKGKTVFFNLPMDPTLVNTFRAYSGAAFQRTNGASEAARYGAAGVVVRSLTTSFDDFAHTGVMRYNENFPKIPAVAISTLGADRLSLWLKEDTGLKFYFYSGCETLPDVQSFNVIGEIRGSLYPDEIITVGGHLDSWDNTEGAHDDGAGCVQAVEVLRLFKKLGVRPKRTVRSVMFMDEEIEQRGGKEYARQAEVRNEKHYFALESDRGGLLPRGFGISAPDGRLEKMLALGKYFEPYGIHEFTKGGGGVDIGPLGQFGVPLSSFVPDPQRYFDYHHSGNDTFDKVNIRELQMGSAAIASLIYLIDKYGL